MNPCRATCVILLLIAPFLTGCTDTVHYESVIPEPEVDTGGTIPLPDGELVTPMPPSPDNVAVNSSSIPLLLNDAHWEIARGCGWTAKNIPESAALFMDSCQVKNLLLDGWTIKGMQYDVDILNNRCRRSLHPEGQADCNWCAEAGPTLVLSYRGILETELMADMEKRTVILFRTTLPDGTGSVSGPGTETIRFHNGTVLYTFRDC